MGVFDIKINDINYNHQTDREAAFYEFFSDKKVYDSITLYFDGSCAPKNPNGNLGYGFAIYDANKKKILEGWGYRLRSPKENTSNNQAEWIALGLGLRVLLESGIEYRNLWIKGDSNHVINQASGNWKIKGEGIYKEDALSVLSEIITPYIDKSTKFSFISRSLNSRCDQLSKYYIDFLARRGVDISINKEDKWYNMQKRTIPSSGILPFGKYKGYSIKEIKKVDAQYVAWLKAQDNIVFTPKPKRKK